MVMRCSTKLLAVVFLLSSFVAQSFAQRPRTTQTEPTRSRTETQINPRVSMEIYARWSAQAGVSRFRFQLARDSGFDDIVVDRVVYTTEIQIADLMPGTYYWRVAPLTRELGQYSAPRAVEAFREMRPLAAEPRPLETENRPTLIEPVFRQPVTLPPPPQPLFVSQDGWTAA